MEVQAPELVQKPAQQSAQGSPKEHEAGQASPVPVQARPQLLEVLQLLPQQTRPSMQVELSLHGQPKPAQPLAATGDCAVRDFPIRPAAPRAVKARRMERRERLTANERAN